MNRRLRSGAVVALVLACAACGVPTQSKPQPIASNDKVTTITNVTTPSGPSASRVVLYFVNNDKLDRVERPVDQIPSDTVAVTQLLSGVTTEEKAAGLLSSIPPQTTALGITVEHGEMTLNLSQQFKPSGDTYLEACAQIVYTVTSIPGITRVRFLVEGDPISAPTVADGNLAVVDRSDYRTLAP